MVPAQVLLVLSVVNREDSNLRNAGTYDWSLLHTFAANFSANQERPGAVA
jgi:hypothetical protein